MPDSDLTHGTTRRLLPVLILAAVALGSCTAARELLSLRQVEFVIDRVTGAEVAGIRVDQVRSYEDLTATDVLRIANAVRTERMPFRFTLHIAGTNPEENTVQARLLEMDWTLFIENRETLNGLFAEEIVFPPGESVELPIDIELDLFEFFSRNARDMFELALNVAGQGGAPKNIRVEADVRIQTPLGPMRYPGGITILSTDAGRGS